MIVVSRAGLREVEHHLNPPLEKAVTIPVWADGREYIVYVAQSPFQQTFATDDQVRAVAGIIADRLEREE